MNNARILLPFLLLFLLPACSTVDKLTGQKKKKRLCPVNGSPFWSFKTA